jgi:AcrR family transcriptional regulator
VGHKHTKDEILTGALATAFDDGLSQLSYGRVAKRLGISDRIVVYYFPTKEDLVAEVLLSLGLELQQRLEATITTPRSDHVDLVRVLWPLLAHADADSVFALFFEANGLAAAGRAPYDSLVPQLVEAWVMWAEEHLEGTPRQRRSEALAAIALTDGLLLLRQLAGPEPANDAARRLGVLGRTR